MAQWKVSDREFMAARIEPGVCKCKERKLRYSMPGQVRLVRPPTPRVGVLRLLLGHMFPTTLPAIPEPKEVQPEVWYTHRFKSLCNWCKYLEAMGATNVRVVSDPYNRTTTIIRED